MNDSLRPSPNNKPHLINHPLKMKGNHTMRKTIQKIISLVACMSIVIALSATLLAVDPSYTVRIKKQNASDNYTHNVTLYQVFKAEVDTSGTEPMLYNIDWSDDVDATQAMTAVTALSAFSSCTKVADIVKVLNTDATSVDAFAKAIEPVLTTSAATTTLGPTDTYKDVDVTSKGPGYYLVTDVIKDGSTTIANSKFMMDAVKSSTTTLEITSKEVVPTLDKKIVDGSSLVDKNQKSVGDPITFQMTSKVPNLKDKGYNRYCYVVEDTLCEGLTYSGTGDPTVTINGTATSDFTFTKTVDATTGETLLKIVFTDFLSKGTNDDLIGKDIVITYQAYLNEKADLTDAGNPNTAKLIYSNDPKHTYSSDTPGTGDVVGQTPEAKTITYTTGMMLIKVDADDNTKLSGAEFKIEGTQAEQVIKTEYVYTKSSTGTYYRLKNGTYTTTAPTTATADQYESTSDKYELTSKTSAIVGKNTSGYVTAEVGADGVLHFDGLGAGDYTITETKAPTGYVADPTPHTLKIECTFDANNKPVWTYTIDGTTCTGTVLLTVENALKSDLPGTGGIGANVFYVAGSVLILSGIALAIAKKRKEAEI